MILAFFLLWSLRKRIKIPGILFSIYLILSGLERYFIEIIRVTKRYNIFGWELSQAQIISLLMVVGGIGMIVYMIFKKEKFIEWGTPKPKEINKAVIEVENPNNQNKKKK
jgi:prolipoprotein diacylglyceryltransferase